MPILPYTPPLEPPDFGGAPIAEPAPAITAVAAPEFERPPVVPTPTPNPMAGVPSFGAGPMPSRRPSFLGGIAPIVAGMLIGKGDPSVVGASMAGFVQGRRLRQAQQEDEYTRQLRERQEAAQFYTRALADAGQFDDPVQFEQWKTGIGPMAQVYGIDPNVFQFSDAKRQKKAQRDAAAVLEQLRKTHGESVDDPAWQQAHSTTLNGQPVKVADLYRLAQAPTVMDASGQAVAPPSKITALTPNTPEEQFYAQYAKEQGARSFAELSTAQQAAAREQWAKVGRAEPTEPSTQLHPVLLNGKRAFVSYNPKTQKFTDSAGNDVTALVTPIPPQSATVAITPTQAATDPRVQQAAQLIASGRMAPSQLATFFSGMGKNSVSQLRPAVMAGVLAINPDFDFAAAESNYAFGKAPATQTTVRFLDNIKETLPQLRRASEAFKRGGVRFINDVLKSGKSQFGDIDVAKFDAARTFLADEIAKVLQGGGTGSGTSDAKLRQASEILSGNMPIDQFAGVLDTVEEMLGTRRRTLTRGTFMEDKGGTPPATPAAPPKKIGRFEIVDVK